jgi:hypothetical protein
MINILNQIVFAGFLAQAQAAPGIPIVTVCEALEGWDRYNGKSIVVVGLVAPTMEGAWQVETCERKILIGGIAVDKSISLSHAVGSVAPAPSCPKDLRWDDTRLDEKLKEVQKNTILHPVTPSEFRYTGNEYRQRWVAIYGRFETGAGMPGHFGHLNGSPAQLISGKNCFCEWKDK